MNSFISGGREGSASGATGDGVEVGGGMVVCVEGEGNGFAYNVVLVGEGEVAGLSVNDPAEPAELHAEATTNINIRVIAPIKIVRLSIELHQAPSPVSCPV
jgi:hypothetical protein